MSSSLVGNAAAPVLGSKGLKRPNDAAPPGGGQRPEPQSVRLESLERQLDMVLELP